MGQLFLCLVTPPQVIGRMPLPSSSPPPSPGPVPHLEPQSQNHSCLMRGEGFKDVLLTRRPPSVNHGPWGTPSRGAFSLPHASAHCPSGEQFLTHPLTHSLNKRLQASEEPPQHQFLKMPRKTRPRTFLQKALGQWVRQIIEQRRHGAVCGRTGVRGTVPHSSPARGDPAVPSVQMET